MVRIPTRSFFFLFLFSCQELSNFLVEKLYQAKRFFEKKSQELLVFCKNFKNNSIPNEFFKIDHLVEKVEFPEYLIPKLREIDILKYFFKAPYGNPISTAAQGCIAAELARGDAGISTMLMVDWALLGYTIETFGSEEQKARYIPKIRNFEMIGGWALTEDKVGSDASNLQTKAEKINETQYKINGTKRWIGNGNRDLLAVWARNTQTKQVEAFIVENQKVQGLTSAVIKNKLAMRMVQNCHITFDNVIVDESQRLPHAKDFATATNTILKHSRAFVCWVCAGVALGVYDNVIKYASNRTQFGKPISGTTFFMSGFQLVQEKIVKIMSNTQAVLLMCFRVSQLVDQNKARISQIAMAKSFITERLREITRWGREIMGGNGIQHDNYLMRALADAEAVYTYEGTYDINVLVAGRELTGLAAFK